MLAAGTVLSLVLAATLIFSKKAKAVRKTRDDHENWLQNGLNTLAKRAQSLEYQYGVREQAFNRSHDEFQNEIHMYRTAAENIRDVIAQLQEVQKSEFLRQFLVRDYIRQISGLTVSDVTMMESFGMDTANDVDRMRLYGVPGLDPEIVMELLDWRREVAQKFVFNPEHGITLASVGQTKELAVRRFKIAQARKILAGAKQVETLADVGKADLTRALAQFERSLAIDPRHSKTLLNVGIVRAFGKQDLEGAAKAFQQVLDVAPGSAEARAARQALDGIRSAHPDTSGGPAKQPGAPN